MIEQIKYLENQAVSCIYCKSTKVIKHGKTSTGNKRYRCRNCGKTWVLERNEIDRPELSEIVEMYLEGKTCRELVDIYHSSPLRINQKIREFLQGTPSWEEYLDAASGNKDFRLIYLIGKSFSCSCKGFNNSMFLALAVDAHSSAVVGFEIDLKDHNQVWVKLLERMKKRDLRTGTFMTNGSKHMEETVRETYPASTLRIYYHKAYRDKELSCCLSRLPINNKLVNDAIKAYETIQNHNLNIYLSRNFNSSLKEYILKRPDLFSKLLRDRLDNRARIRVEGLIHSFQSRFEKFHMLKDDPYPLINGWIAKWMTTPVNGPFTRLSYVKQVPSAITFKEYSCGALPKEMSLLEHCKEIEIFVAEVSARAIHLPIFYSKCEMKIDKCSLI